MIQVIHRALDIIELILNNNNKGMPLRDIANELNLNHSTCANILKTLTARRYLEKSKTKRDYKIGPMLIAAMSDSSQSYGLIQAAEGPMKVLSKFTKENSTLAILKGNIRFCIHQILVEHDLKVVSGREKPVYETSTGRVILAFLERREQMKFIGEYGLPKKDIWPGVEDEISLLNELDNIKKVNYAIQVSTSHVLGIAVPIGNVNGFVAALGIYLPEVRFAGAKKDLIIEELFKAQKNIHKNLK